MIVNKNLLKFSSPQNLNLLANFIHLSYCESDVSFLLSFKFILKFFRL